VFFCDRIVFFCDRHPTRIKGLCWLSRVLLRPILIARIK